jgi:hypothetical protein
VNWKTGVPPDKSGKRGKLRVLISNHGGSRVGIPTVCEHDLSMKKSVRELPMSRPPLERMMRIHTAIASGKHPNASFLSREFEVSTKTIQRDIDFMRDRMGLPIDYSPQR